jgi:hypothetical protein
MKLVMYFALLSVFFVAPTIKSAATVPMRPPAVTSRQWCMWSMTLETSVNQAARIVSPCSNGLMRKQARERVPEQSLIRAWK